MGVFNGEFAPFKYPFAPEGGIEYSSIYLYIMKVYEENYNAELKCICCKWTGYATSQQFREGMLLHLNMLISSRAVSMLVDLKEMVLIGMEDQHWMESLFLPLAISGGLKQVAIVQPSYYFNKVAVENVVFRIDPSKVCVRYFGSYEEGKEWVKHCSIA